MSVVLVSNSRGCDRAMATSGSTQVVGVFGWPVEHSVSPTMHNAAFGALGLDWCYVPFPVQPERLADAVAGVRALGLRGVNVTVPHKAAMLSLVDELTPEARAIGAVNTVVPSTQGLVGHNTDARGFYRALAELGFSPEGCNALVLGAGGAARAVVCALASAGARVTVCNRNPERAQSLVNDLGSAYPEARLCAVSLTTDAMCNATRGTDLVVNATTVGMWPAVDASPWPVVVPFPVGALVYDLIYNPRETLFLRSAREVGLRIGDGLGMLVHQGAEAFKLWTGREPPIGVMRSACESALGKH